MGVPTGINGDAVALDSYGSLAETMISAAVDGQAFVGDAAALLQGDYLRAGPDLLIIAPDGGRHLVADFFAVSPPPDLAGPQGMVLSGTVAARLAGPLAPGQVAAADDVVQVAQAAPIGTVQGARGAVTVERADGTVVTLQPGDPVYAGDIVITAGGSSVGIVFLDETEFSLGSGGRMVLDEMIYDPGTGDGQANVNLLSGTFSFVSGQLAKAGPDAMTVTTPVATIGIRGTSGTIGINSGENGPNLKVVLIPDANGSVGEIQVTTPSGQSFSLNAPMGAFKIEAGQPQTFTMSLQEFNQDFGEALGSLSTGSTLRENVEQVAPPTPEDAARVDAQRSQQQEGPGEGDDGAAQSGEEQPPEDQGAGDQGAEDQGAGDQPAEGEAPAEDGAPAEGDGPVDGDAAGKGDGPAEGEESAEGAPGDADGLGLDPDAPPPGEQLAEGPAGPGGDGPGGQAGDDPEGDDGPDGPEGDGEAGLGLDPDGPVDGPVGDGPVGGGPGGPPTGPAAPTGPGRVVEPGAPQPGDGPAQGGGQAGGGQTTLGTAITQTTAIITTNLQVDPQQPAGQGSSLPGSGGATTGTGGGLGGTGLGGGGLGTGPLTGVVTPASPTLPPTTGKTTTKIKTETQAAADDDNNVGTGSAGGAAEDEPTTLTVSVSGSTPYDAATSSKHITVTGDLGDNTITTGSGNDVIRGGAGADTMKANAGNDTVIGGAGADTIVGGTGAGDDYYDGGNGATDTSGDDWLTYTSTTAGITLHTLGAVGAPSGRGEATGSEIGTDSIYGIEHVKGGSGDDTLTGHEAANSFVGGAGNDTIDGGDGSDHLDGGLGSDTLSFAGGGTQGAVASLAGSTVTDQFGKTDTIQNFENILGSAQGDTLTGNAGANTLRGGDGDDTLEGGAGADLLEGQGGTNTLSFATGGTQGATADLSSSTVTDQFGDTDSISGFLHLKGSAQGDVLTGTSGDNSLWGGAGADTLSAGGGDDYVSGGAGADVLAGGAGIDVLSFAEGGTQGAVANLSNTTVTDQFGATDTISGFEVVVGSSYGDTLTGGTNDDVNVVIGMAGNDRLEGNTGSNVYTEVQYDVEVSFGGTSGVDVTLGGSATDSFGNTDTLLNIDAVRGTKYDDVLTSTDASQMNWEGYTGLDGADTINGGAGWDEVFYDDDPAAVSIILGVSATDGWGNADVLSNIEAVVGSLYGDTLKGDANDNALTGLKGADQLEGGAGTDEVRYDLDADQDGTAGVTVDLANGTATDGFGDSDTLVGIENVRGSGQADSITGDGNDNVFRGLGGADTLTGGAGSDTADYSLDSRYGGTAGIYADVPNQTIVDGFGAIDTISGIEVIRGGSANDTFVSDVSTDVTFWGAGGTDRIKLTDDGGGHFGRDSDAEGNTWLTYGVKSSGKTVRFGDMEQLDDGAGTVYTLAYTASSGVVTGSSGSDMLVAETAGSTLQGGAGNDFLIGLAGNDYLDGGDGDDEYYIHSSSTGADKIADSGGTGDTILFGDSASIPYRIYMDNVTGATDKDLVIQMDSGGSHNVIVVDQFVGSSIDYIDTGDDDGGGTTRFKVSQAESGGFNGTAANEFVVAHATTAGGTFNGGDGDDLIFDDNQGNSGSIVGGAGNDSIVTDAQSTSTTMVYDGGTGTDELIITASGWSKGSKVIQNFEEITKAGEGDAIFDWTLITNGLNSISKFRMEDGGEIKLKWNSSADASTYSLDLSSISVSGSDSAAALQIIGREVFSAAEAITGTQGNDQIMVTAYDGNTYDGGTGTDELSFQDTSMVTGDYTEINLGAGTFIHYDNAFTAKANVNFSNIERVVGTSASDTFTGTSGDDWMAGHSGSDTFTGGGGVDTYDYTTATLGTGQGTDTINDWTSDDRFLFKTETPVWGDSSDSGTLRYLEIDNSGGFGLTGGSNVDLSSYAPAGTDTSAAGIVVLGDGSGGGTGLEVWYVGNLSSATDGTDSYQIASLNGASLDDIANTNFVNENLL